MSLNAGGATPEAGLALLTLAAAAFCPRQLVSVCRML
jgi:hypothetical protein